MIDPSDIYEFDSWKPWVSVLILWAIHGNEPCGTIAIQQLIQDLEMRNIVLNQGRLTLIPICNPKAFELKQRQTQDNLNRMFYPNNTKISYEALLAKQIAPYIANADALIDLHSMTTSNDVFMFKSVAKNPELDRFASSLGVKEWMDGWDSVYDESEQWATDDFARTTDTMGICVECWQHDDPNSPIVAKQCIDNALMHFGLISGTPDYEKNIKKTTIKSLVRKTKEGSRTKQRKHGDSFQAWDTIVNYNDWTVLEATYAWVMILPKPRATLGGEWFYLGVRE